jgi:Cu-processing system ATP-binding protein
VAAELAQEAAAVIAFRAFTKRFGAQAAVLDLSVEVRRGEVFALLGPNGSGKTTSLKAAAGLIRPTSGEVLLGEPPRPAGDPSARRILSFLPQRVSFPEALSGRDVVEFFRLLRRAPPERTDEALRFAALDGAADRFVGTYSGGMVQRLGLAVAVVPEAPVFLLDEPTAALDPEGLGAFHGVVERSRALGRTVLFTSHQLGDAEHLADRIGVLVEGRLVACLSARELQDRLADRGSMRLRLSSPAEGLLDRVRLVAPQAEWLDDELIVPGPAASRPKVIDLVRSAGCDIRSLTAEEGRLDVFYRELVSDSQRTPA